MKPGHLLGIAIIAVCIAAAGYSLHGSVRHSLTVKEAMAAVGEPCKVYGEVVRGSERYDIRAPRLEFLLKDEKGDTIPVVFRNSKPATFDTAPQVGATGAYRDSAFQADNLVLKCPSKYIKEPQTPAKAGSPTNPYAALGKGA